MLQKMRGALGKWRESRHQHAVDRALYKAEGGRKLNMQASEAVDQYAKATLPRGIDRN
jgi:hypothetical protein